MEHPPNALCVGWGWALCHQVAVRPPFLSILGLLWNSPGNQSNLVENSFLLHGKIMISNNVKFDKSLCIWSKLRHLVELLWEIWRGFFIFIYLYVIFWEECLSLKTPRKTLFKFAKIHYLFQWIDSLFARFRRKKMKHNVLLSKWKKTQSKREATIYRSVMEAFI